MYKNLIFNYDKIKNIYNNELKQYKYILPNNRDNIPIGSMIKYLNINFNENIKEKFKLKNGFLISYDKYSMLLKSSISNSKFYFKIKFTNNYIFYYKHFTTLRDYLEENYNNIIKEIK